MLTPRRHLRSEAAHQDEPDVLHNCERLATRCDRHASELQPFADSVHIRFIKWMSKKAVSMETFFTPEQLTWLELIREHIATSLSIEPEDFDYAPFSQRGGLGKAHQLFGEQLPALLDELNEVLAA